MTYLLHQIFRILCNGLKSLLYNFDGQKRSIKQLFIGFIVIPAAIVVFSIWRKFDMADIIDTLLTVLSIFTALIFGVLFTVPDKLSQRMERSKSKTDEATRNYLVRFVNFTRSFVEQITFIIVLSIVLIVSLVIQKINTNIDFAIIHTAINLAILYFLVIYILHTISNIYSLLMDDIKVSEKNLPK